VKLLKKNSISSEVAEKKNLLVVKLLKKKSISSEVAEKKFY